MPKLKQNPQPPTSLEDHLTEALQYTENDEVRYHLREALQVVYAEPAG